jgi:hypothetical protein
MLKENLRRLMSPSRCPIAKRLLLERYYPITPVHTLDEMKLFKWLHREFEGKLAVVLAEWNNRANRKTVFYKALHLI